jgi:multidrug efflux pump subunit AcrA (membrane-fusion protein)
MKTILLSLICIAPFALLPAAEAPGHDHAAEKGDHAGHDHAAETGHDHAAEEDPHAGHDHEAPLDPERIANTIVLDETGVENLQLKTVAAKKRNFETTVFAIGRIEEIPARHSAVSSRIPGRAIKVHAFEGDHVKAGQLMVEIESRQPGNPPPVIKLTAPQPGLVITASIHVGQPVAPDMQLFDISDRSEMWAVARIPEQDAKDIRPGTMARIRIPALGNRTMERPLNRFGVSADPESGTIEGIFVLPNPKHRLQPGMRAEFSIVTSTQPDVLCIPKQAVQGDPAKRVVYVKDPELKNVFIRTPVVLGRQNDESAEVLEGLAPGQQVVTNGSYSLGFVSSGSGSSLRETLDAAHGHKHAEDGSELTEEDDHDHEATEHEGESSAGGKTNIFLAAYAAIATLLLLFKIPKRRPKN